MPDLDLIESLVDHALDLLTWNLCEAVRHSLAPPRLEGSPDVLDGVQWAGVRWEEEYLDVVLPEELPRRL